MSTLTSRNKMHLRVWRIAMTALLAALATVLMMLSFSVPFMPSFIKLDFSELPALLASFSLGPISGAAVCLIKNLINLPLTTTGGVGELANFLMGVTFVLPAGLIYRYRKTRLGALIASGAGALAMALCSLPINYFISYPAYSGFLPIEAIVDMYKAILPSMDGLLMCLVTFNIPFTLLKGLLDVLLCFLIYKPLSPLLQGKFIQNRG
ncbi:MAG: ECF transporter S component [Clostridia bacterium]|nr:ECF transporter S component [Clostridia bacterium]